MRETNGPRNFRYYTRGARHASSGYLRMKNRCLKRVLYNNIPFFVVYASVVAVLIEELREREFWNTRFD